MAVVVSINLVVAALHFVTGPDYPGPWRHFVNGYLIAITLPVAAYFLLAVNDETIRFLRPWFVKSGIVFTVISSAEMAQYLGSPIFGETYDPLGLCSLCRRRPARGRGRSNPVPAHLPLLDRGGSAFWPA